MWLDTSAVVFKKKRFRWIGIESIENKTVGWIRAYNYQSHLSTSVNIQELNYSHQGWKMLALDRLDFYMDSITELNSYTKNEIPNIHEYSIEPVLHKKMYMRFSKSKRSKLLIELFDKRIMELFASKKLMELYSLAHTNTNYIIFLKERIYLKKLKKGFTMIELLIVIAIIGVLG